LSPLFLFSSCFVSLLVLFFFLFHFALPSCASFFSASPFLSYFLWRLRSFLFCPFSLLDSYFNCFFFLFLASFLFFFVYFFSFILWPSCAFLRFPLSASSSLIALSSSLLFSACSFFFCAPLTLFSVSLFYAPLVSLSFPGFCYSTVTRLLVCLFCFLFALCVPLSVFFVPPLFFCLSILLVLAFSFSVFSLLLPFVSFPFVFLPLSCSPCLFRTAVLLSSSYRLSFIFVVGLFPFPIFLFLWSSAPLLVLPLFSF